MFVLCMYVKSLPIIILRTFSFDCLLFMDLNWNKPFDLMFYFYLHL